MWFSERYTFSLGRSEVPRIFLRMRSCTCRRFVFFDVRVSIKNVLGRWSLVVGQNQDHRHQREMANDRWPATNDGLLRSGLAHFLLQTLAGITHTLVLV